MGYQELLRTQVAFRRLWLGQVISELGDWLQMIALLCLFPAHGSPVEALSGIFIVRMLPSIVWAPLAGVIADRFPRGRVMVACDLGRAVIVLSYLFLRGPEDVLWIYGLLFAQESLTALFEPARSATLPQIVEPRALLAANSLSGATWSAMLAIGSALGGLIAGTLGARAAFLADAASFLLSAALIAGIRVPPVVRDANAAHANHAKDTFGMFALREGLSYLRSHKPQASAALVKGLWGLAGGVVCLFYIYAALVFTPSGQGPARATGLLYAGRGLGALIGPLVARRVWGESPRALRRGVQIGFPMAAIAYVAFAYAPTALLASLCLVCAHAGGSTCWVNSTQLLQIAVPNHLQGRVFAVELAVFTFCFALSAALVGKLLGRGLLDLRGVTFVMAAAAVVSTIGWALLMGRYGRRLDDSAFPENSGPAPDPATLP